MEKSIEEILSVFSWDIKKSDSVICADFEVNDITLDSRQVKQGDLFIAMKGLVRNGNQFISEAISRGAVAILTDSATEMKKDYSVPLVFAKELSHDLSRLSSFFYDAPADQLQLVGITGTNGKTTISYCIKSLLETWDKSCGLTGTIEHWDGKKSYNPQNTTPGVIKINSLYAQMIKNDLSYAVSEVSSHALDQGRLESIKFLYSVFTNLSQDHLDYHVDMDSYFESKMKLFSQLKDDGVAIINLEDKCSSEIVKRVKHKKLTVGFCQNADYYIKFDKMNFSGTSFDVIRADQKMSFVTPLIGEFNLLNLGQAIAVLDNEGMPKDLLIKGIAEFKGAPGRMERVEPNSKLPFWVYVDYAHTPDAMENILSSVVKLKEQKAFSRLTVVFGCGGDRDVGKRAKMASVAEKYADDIFVTSDNPRTESPQNILSDIEKGFKGKRFLIVEDRRKALAMAINHLKENDLLLVLGKGHEDYQIMGHQKIWFDDREICQEYLNKRLVE